MELEVLQLNINYGHNKEIMEKCKPLWEYAVFIGKIKSYSKSMPIEEAVDKVVKECIEQGILKDILIKHQAEVKNMILTEYDEEKTMRLFKKEFEEEAAEKVREAEEAAEKRVAAEVAAKLEAEKRVAAEVAAKVEAEKRVAAEVAAKLEAEKKVAEIEEKYKKLQIEMEEMKKSLGE